ncbi:unnamed protein product [Effrenium voratum]|nr:unnamed protein product [Effrenium voratum]
MATMDFVEYLAELEEAKLPRSSVKEVRLASNWLTRWLLEMGDKVRDPAFHIGQIKFTYGHVFIVCCGLSVLTFTLYLLLSTDAAQRKIKSASLRHILMRTEADILAAKARLDSGETFGKVARALSVCRSASDGGDLGVFQPCELDPAFDRVAFNPKTPIGEVVGPVKTKFGYHLFRLEFRTGFDADAGEEKKSA